MSNARGANFAASKSKSVTTDRKTGMIRHDPQRRGRLTRHVIDANDARKETVTDDQNHTATSRQHSERRPIRIRSHHMAADRSGHTAQSADDIMETSTPPAAIRGPDEIDRRGLIIDNCSTWRKNTAAGAFTGDECTPKTTDG